MVTASQDRLPTEPIGTSAADEPYELARLLFAVTERMQAAFDGVAAAFGLTTPQARTLLRLATPAPMRALAEHLSCDASNVTGIIDRLERRDLVVRRPDPTDRRVKLLALTPAGRRLRAQVQEAVHRASPVMTDLDDEDRLELRDLLRRLARSDAARSDEAPSAAIGKAPAAPRRNSR